MTFALAPLGAIPGVGTPSPLAGLGGAAGIGGMLPGAAQPSGAVTGAAFGNTLTSAIENLQQVQQNADALAVRAVSGDLEDVHEYTIAASEAKLTMELTAAIRNKAVDAFNEILRMQG